MKNIRKIKNHIAFILTISLAGILPIFLCAQQEETKTVVELLHSKNMGIPDEYAKVENELIGRGKNVLPLFREQFNSPEESLMVEMTKRNLIIDVLKKTADPDGIKLLLEFLKEECDKPFSGIRWAQMPKETFIRRRIGMAFIEIGKVGVNILGEYNRCHGNQENEFSKILIMAMGLAGDHAYFDVILGYLTMDQDPWIRAMAARSLGRIGDKRAIPYLENALRDEACFEEIPDAASDVILHRTTCPVKEDAMRSLKEFGLKINRRGNLIWIER